jgi:hypothetical protein
MHNVRDTFVYVDELKPGRLLQYLKTALRKPGYAGTQIFERYYCVTDLVKTYLTLLKQRAETVLGEKISAATFGRPVKFASTPTEDRKAEETLRAAAHEAGFNQVDFELEPIAAALDYEQTLEKPQRAVIFDFGGGTLDRGRGEGPPEPAPGEVLSLSVSSSSVSALGLSTGRDSGGDGEPGWPTGPDPGKGVLGFDSGAAGGVPPG